MPIRILVVDDSAFMRKILSAQMNSIEGFEVVATAVNGETALQKMDTYKPDVITLDVEMPGMNGLETVKRIREKSNIPVFMLSSLQGTDITIQALESGATDFIEKPKNLRENPDAFRNELASHIGAVFQRKARIPAEVNVQRKKRIVDTAFKAVVIGASTGGPRALLQVISSLPKDLAIPVFIVQHMPEGFTQSFAQRLNQNAAVPVKEAVHQEPIVPGTVYVAPGNYHMAIEHNTIHLSQSEKLNGVRPAVDVLFESAAKKYTSDLLAIVMTGMGKDGTVGMTHVKATGGVTIVQDEETSVVYGMPGNAVKAGVVDAIYDLDDIAKLLHDIER